MSRTVKFGLVGLAVLIAAGAAFWYFVLRDDSPPPVSLDSALDSLGSPTPGATTTTGETPSPEATTPTGAADESLEGDWEVDTTVDTFVGYRVEEELAQIGATTAVGRTPNVTGSLSINGDTVELGATIEADMTTLRSDSGLRDGQLRNQGIEFGRFPTATFTLTEAVTIPEGMAAGERVSATLIGDFELHGVTRSVEIPVEAQVSNGYLVVVGSIVIQFADYDITAPSAARVLSIEDHGVMEFQLFFSKS